MIQQAQCKKIIGRKKNSGATKSKTSNNFIDKKIIYIIIVNILVLGALYYKNSINSHNNKVDKTLNTQDKKTNTENNKNNSLNNTKFEFYKNLTKMDTKQPIIQPTNKKYNNLKNKNPTIHSYYLQISSFKNNLEAEQEKASLTLNGFKAKVDNNKILVGPYIDMSHAQKAKKQLLELGSSNIAVIKIN